MKLVRNNQLINDVIYNGTNLLLIERVKPQEVTDETTTIFVCDGRFLQVGETKEYRRANCQYVRWHEPLMYWKNYGKYFSGDVRVIVCYPKYNKVGFNRSDLSDVAYEIAGFIVSHLIRGKIVLIGHSKGGLIMYRAAKEIPRLGRRDITVVTVSTPFGGTKLMSKKEFAKCPKRRFKKIINWAHSKVCSENPGSLDALPNSEFLANLKPLPKEIRHIAFNSFINPFAYQTKGVIPWILKHIDKWCEVRGDGIVPITSQMEWPNGRMPEACFTVSSTHESSLEMVLEDFGSYAGTDLFFSKISELQNDAMIYDIFGSLFQ